MEAIHLGISDFRVMPFMSWGMWVAKCPRPQCMNAEKRGWCNDGTWGGLEADRFTCRPSHDGCGLVCGVDWPANISDIEALLLARPVKGTRNWAPGESLHDLLKENAGHGLVPIHDLEIMDAEIRSFGPLEFVPKAELEAEGWRG
jgi:hypothetical protein